MTFYFLLANNNPDPDLSLRTTISDDDAVMGGGAEEKIRVIQTRRN